MKVNQLVEYEYEQLHNRYCPLGVKAPRSHT